MNTGTKNTVATYVTSLGPMPGRCLEDATAMALKAFDDSPRAYHRDPLSYFHQSSQAFTATRAAQNTTLAVLRQESAAKTLTVPQPQVIYGFVVPSVLPATDVKGHDANKNIRRGSTHSGASVKAPCIDADAIVPAKPLREPLAKKRSNPLVD